MLYENVTWDGNIKKQIQEDIQIVNLVLQLILYQTNRSLGWEGSDI